MHPDQRAFPLDALTASQLGQYRKELERSLRGIPQDAPVRALLHQKIAETVAEQSARQDEQETR